MDYVDLVNIDLAKFDDPAGRKQLAKDLYEAATGYGFLTLTNHGISDETYQRQMRIANAAMTLKPDEKAPYEGTYSRSSGLRGREKANSARVLKSLPKKMPAASTPDTNPPDPLDTRVGSPRPWTTTTCWFTTPRIATTPKSSDLSWRRPTRS